MRIAWVFYDPVEDETYSFEINPNEGGTPERTKNLTYQATAAPNGRVIAFEGMDAPEEINVSGTLLSQDQFDALNSWYDKRNQIQLTDDLGREFWVYIKSLRLQRVRSINYPWRHSFDITMMVLDWETP